jgi:hypothetical protein
LVSGGVLLLPRVAPGQRNTFRLPYINGRFIVPVFYAIFVYAFWDRITSSSKQWHSLQDALFLVFVGVATILTVFTVIKKLSLIPIMGVLFCAYLLIEIPAISWEWFFAWMAIGLIIYFLYGYKNSRLAVKS